MRVSVELELDERVAPYLTVEVLSRLSNAPIKSELRLGYQEVCVCVCLSSLHGDDLWSPWRWSL